MEHFIDYLSISIPTPRMMTQFMLSLPGDFAFYPDDRTQRLINLICDAGNWEEYGRKGVFDTQVHYHEFGFTYFEGSKASVSLIQFTGQGCQTLRDMGVLEDVLRDWSDRLTRIDVSIDLASSCDPRDFAPQRANNRFKSGKVEYSETGISVAVGSRKSDLHARVYRYHTPHPRHRTLRIEYEAHDDVAKQIGADIIREGVHAVGLGLGVRFGWNHEDYLKDVDAPKYEIPLRKSVKAGTEFWLHKQVLPALRKFKTREQAQFLGEFIEEVRAIMNEILSETDGKHDSQPALPNWIANLADGLQDHYPSMDALSSSRHSVS